MDGKHNGKPQKESNYDGGARKLSQWKETPTGSPAGQEKQEFQ